MLIDHHDSYTSSIPPMLSTPPVILPYTVPLEIVNALKPTAIVLSPGPGDVHNPVDTGVSSQILSSGLYDDTPILGICLGHQIICSQLGLEVSQLPSPTHGIAVDVEGEWGGRWMKYNSWCPPSQSVPSGVEVKCESEDGIMGIRSGKWLGCQGHPESIETEVGAKIIGEFESMFEGEGTVEAATQQQQQHRQVSAGETYTAAQKSFDYNDQFEFFKKLNERHENTFILDSNTDNKYSPNDRYSYVGFAEKLYDEGDILLNLNLEKSFVGDVDGDFKGGYVGYLNYEYKKFCRDGSNLSPDITVLKQAIATLRGRGDERRCNILENYLKELEGEREEEKRGEGGEEEEEMGCFGEVRNWVVFDHELNKLSAVTLDTHADGEWFKEVEEILDEENVKEVGGVSYDGEPSFSYRIDPSQYKEDISTIKSEIKKGETYEICLTNRLQFSCPPSSPRFGLSVFSNLRKINPAPYSCYFNYMNKEIACSSPERFIKISDGVAESKPIKGTIGRGATPEEDLINKQKLKNSVKDKAENVMIADLVRSDFSRVCTSVKVDELYAIESYETVHQMVSKVTGELGRGRTEEFIKATFPGGSMTGAPKRRSMRIIEGLEKRERGVYSGGIGWLGYDGSASLNMVIRTVVVDKATGVGEIGCGGAITGLSDVEEEWEEVRIKAERGIKAVKQAWSGTKESGGGTEGGGGKEATKKRRWRDRVGALRAVLNIK
ncbi:hypothetical protein TrVE_jg11199 [Triparma verrucosa]|uniref:aminodeoxychorismate synthase n=1 Tax=Triparma verrucosa TaxID=1606542 RepID=A0A9W7F6A8_9STRA|nr:hypothetical protein TrVE_jg11199 [Triparma verrucosa]